MQRLLCMQQSQKHTGDFGSLAGTLIPKTYVKQGLEALKGRQNLLRDLLAHRRMPEKGWDDATIEYALTELALMDSNNFLDNVGVGEREARVYSQLVARRHYRFAHGVGRSGDIAEPQPKAAGSSLMAKITSFMARDALRIAGLDRMKSCVVLPMATGMSVTLTLLTLRGMRKGAKYVVWPRIDQKSCLKAIVTAGFTPLVVENVMDGDVVRTDVERVRQAIISVGAENVLCVLTTTSCFAPRVPDPIADIAVLCKDLDVPHVINNAYGLQCSKISHDINEGVRIGRVDACIQSTDKNFLVPVGGAIVASPDEKFCERVCKVYPGRASSTPVQDLFITLLSMGREGYKNLLKERKTLVGYFVQRLSEVASKHKERLLYTKRNTISFAISLAWLDALPGPPESEGKASPLISLFGSMLFMGCVSGTRIVPLNGSKTVADIEFRGYGSHVDRYHCSYLTAACAIGIAKPEIDEFMRRLDKMIMKFQRTLSRAQSEDNLALHGEGWQDHISEVEEDGLEIGPDNI